MRALLPTLESFIHSGQTGFDYKALTSSAPHSNLRSLAITGVFISRHHLRSIVLAFPALRDLSGFGYYGERTPYTAHLPTLEHSSLHTLSIRYTKDLRVIKTARIRFPNVRTLSIEEGQVENSTTMLTQLSTLFPGIDCLEAHGVDWRGKRVAKARGVLVPIYPFTRLLFYGRSQEHFRVHVLVSQMPFLVRLEVGLIGPTGLNAISSTCSNALVYLQFSLRANHSVEVCRVLATCSRLKECLGDGHVVLAEDIINGLAWTCMSLEKLDIVIRVPFKTNLGHVQCWERARIKTSVTRRTAAEKAALDQQEASNAMQQRIHAKLARFRNLVEINFGWSYTYDNWITMSTVSSHRSDIAAGINFSQESGFGQVVSLPNLKKIELRKYCETRTIRSTQ